MHDPSTIDLSQPRPGEPSGFVFGPFRLDVLDKTLWRENERLALGNRSFSILHALLERPGELVSKAVLFKRAWPDISVDEANLRVQVATLRKALGGQGANITAVTGLGYLFIGSVTRASSVAGSRSSRIEPPGGIDQPLGREEELAATVKNLLQRRLVTIAGPGGIGKTTLALAVARNLRDEFQDGVCFVDLGLVSDASLVAAALAAALQTPLNTQDPAESLLAYLPSLNLLIVLDCCEHVVDTAALLAERILKAAPRVHILVTSREALRAQGELILELDALQMPPSTEAMSSIEAMRFSAVQLFVRCAASNSQDFEINDENTILIVEVCRRLDGIPLAIELAAALVGFLGLRAVRDKLDQRFDVLTRNRRTSLARHRTLSATMDWSYGLLSEHERVVLRKLSVFAGKFTMEAAVEVASGADIDASDAASLIIDLAAKSLLAVDRRSGRPEYRLLETTRVYARQQPAPDGEKQQSALKHASYFLGFLQSFDWESYDSERDRGMVSGCIQEVRVALEWAHSVADYQDLAVKLSLAAERPWLELALVDECKQQMWLALERTSRQPHFDPGSRMRAIVGLATAQIIAYSSDINASLLEEALRLADKLGDRNYQLRALWALFHSELVARRPHEALRYARQFEVLELEQSGQPDKHMANHFLGWAHLAAGELAPARRHLESFLDNYLAPPRFHATLFGFAKHVTAKVALGVALWLQGLPEQALAIVEQGLAEAEELKHAATTLYALAYGTCFIALFTENRDAGRKHLQVLDSAVRLHKRWESLTSAYNGMVSRRDGDSSSAIECLDRALTGVRPAKVGILYPFLLLELAHARFEIGDIEGSERAVQLALECSSGPDDVIVNCSALRVRAKIMAQRADDLGAAEALLVKAIRLSRTQGALTLELASTTTLSRIWISAGRSQEALSLLSGIVQQIVEGHDFPPMIEARALIKSLEGSTGGP